MDFPVWAPATLCSQYEGILRNEKDFSETAFSHDELTHHAQKNGFPTWGQCKYFMSIYRDCLGRMLTDENARSVWEWIADERVIGLVWGKIARRLETWHQGQGITKKEFSDERDEIAKLSAKLAGKLAKHIGNPRLSFNYPALVPEEYREQALRTIHPELLKRTNDKGFSGAVCIGIGMPPLHVMLNRLSELVGEAAEERDWPTKIHNGSGLRKLLLKDICWVLDGNGYELPTTKLANFLFLILHDQSITDATVRGDLKGTEWRKKLSAKDSAKK